jgi:CheY-like chemotaxis protein
MLRILMVDDEAAILTMLKIVMESASFQVETAHSAAQGVASLKSEKFDFVLTDMRMETPNAGYDVIRAARQIQPRPVIAILTAFPIASAEWKQSGADALLIKGSEVLRLPETLLSLRKALTAREVAPMPQAVGGLRTR